MSESELEELNDFQDRGGFSNRSDMLRSAIQSFLAEHRKLETLQGNITVVCTILYSSKGKDMQCLNIQHEYSRLVEAMVHSHANGDVCVEVMVVKGDADDVRRFILSLRNQRKVSRIEVVSVE
jgi:CopG family nickel-responsive transcriptional regulator